ncbi:MAG: DMT family protein [Devosia sp.]
MNLLSPAVLPILMLIGSNTFMTTAWYGHLKFPSAPMWIAVMASWGIALFEYWLAVPANRIGYGTYSASELKAIQELISISVFVVFSVVVLGERLTINTGLGFALIAVGAFFIFNGPFK